MTPLKRCPPVGTPVVCIDVRLRIYGFRYGAVCIVTAPSSTDHDCMCVRSPYGKEVSFLCTRFALAPNANGVVEYEIAWGQ